MGSNSNWVFNPFVAKSVVVIFLTTEGSAMYVNYGHLCYGQEEEAL